MVGVFMPLGLSLIVLSLCLWHGFGTVSFGLGGMGTFAIAMPTQSVFTIKPARFIYLFYFVYICYVVCSMGTTKNSNLYVMYLKAEW